MSLLAATQIPKPSDEQAFERACVPLWQGLLKDPNVQKNARRGQGQDGVDLYGMRNRDPDQYVGIQCKLKGDGKQLSEKEVRDEVEKALKFKPALREYFIVTTAPDDGEMHELARVITRELRDRGQQMLVYVWGWNTLEEKISGNDEARKAFDPSFGPFSGRILDNTEDLLRGQVETRHDLAVVNAKLTQITAAMSASPGDTTVSVDVLEAHLDADVDSFRELINVGRPRTALPLLEGLLERVRTSASGRILFRIKANIGACRLALGEDQRAAELLSEAYEHAPNEPKAIANKAFSLLLRGDWRELLRWGEEALSADPENEGLAGYLVQAARFDLSITNPLEIIPDGLQATASVAIAHVDFLRHRGSIPGWREAARSALAAHPTESYARQFAAEADLDEVLSDPIVQRTRLLTPEQRERVSAVAALLRQQWDKARGNDGAVRPEDAALCCNLIVAYHTLDELPAALEVARQGLEVAPDDVEIAKRAAVVAVDGHDDALAGQVLPRLPPGPDAVVLAFRFYSARGEWREVASLCQTQAQHIPEVERILIVTTGRLAEIKISPPDDIEQQLSAIASDAANDPRSSIVVADFAREAGFEDLSEAAYKRAAEQIGSDSHIASRLMVAMHAARRGDAKVAADLLSGHVAESHDSEALRALTRALVNDHPIRRRAIRFFEQLPPALRSLSFYLHSEGLLHYNRGALKQAEDCLRQAIAVSPDLTNYLALFSTLRRREREAEIKPILTALDLSAIRGTPGQKMLLAQQLLAGGMAKVALPFAYDVLQSAKNDPEAALRYFGLMMLDPNGRHIPRARVVGVDIWVRLESSHGEPFSFVVGEGEDRPAEGIMTVGHPLAAGAIGLKVGDTLTINAAFGGNTTWRVAEIKHKYLHALHDVMANFQARFPDAKGFYTIRMQENDVQPALDEVRRVSESNRKLADLYLQQHLPMSMVASRFGRDSVGFAEYVRTLGHDITTAVGNVPERDAERAIIVQHRAGGAVLDTYAAWTAATMDALDILGAVFGKVVIPQSSMDQLRGLRERSEIGASGRSMTIGWHNGQYIRQEFTREDIRARDQFIDEQIQKIEAVCEVMPAAGPDVPSELALMLTETFDTDVLDAADLAASGYVLLSEDLYYRQMAVAAVGPNIRGVCLQSVFAFARETQLVAEKRHADTAVKLAWRRHAHVSFDAETLFLAWQADLSDSLADFSALADFIGIRNAEMRSHVTVAFAFLDRLWRQSDLPALRVMRTTGIVLDRLIRFREKDWALSLAIVADGSDWRLREYIERWIQGHFLDSDQVRDAEAYLSAIKARAHLARVSKRRPSTVPSISSP